jgi:hypothetical protein
MRLEGGARATMGRFDLLGTGCPNGEHSRSDIIGCSGRVRVESVQVRV